VGGLSRKSLGMLTEFFLPNYKSGIMEYTIERAQPFIGKRVVVSLRDITANGEEKFSGLWGIVDSVHEGGLLLKVEGGIDEEFWMLPPDIDALIPSKHESYQHEGFDAAVADVDYEAYFSRAESLEDLNDRDA
jgi:hypothetical protein